MRIAAIDIGSNSVRLLIGEAGRDASGIELKAIARAGEPCRLARGLGETGRVDPELSARAIGIVGEFLERARSLGAGHVVIGATAALRDATNGPQVAADIERAAGIPVRILTAEMEARLIYESVAHGLGAAMRRSPCMVFDLGGGSTEVVSGVGEKAGRWTSLPFGAVTLTEKYLQGNPPSPEETDALLQGVRGDVMRQCALFPERTPVLAGVGGTITVLALVDRGLTHYEPSLVEGWQITPERLDELTHKLLEAPLSIRRSWPAMGEGRADIVAAGVLVVKVLVERFPAPVLHCSTQGLRYGLARLAAEEALNGVGPEAPA